jgi:hypothetical protein
MIRQQPAWIMNGEAITECQIMDISMRGAKIIPDGIICCSGSLRTRV